MTNQLTSLQCPSCGGLLRSLDARVWQCAYCESRYVLLGEEVPVPGLTRVADGTSPENWLYGDCWPDVTEDVARARYQKYLAAIDSFGRKFGRPPMPHARTNSDIRNFWRARKGHKEAAKQFGAEA